MMGVETGTQPMDPLSDKLRKQEARSEAQGGRWLEPSDVAKEPAGGYGIHHHIRQTDTEEVKEALAHTKEPGYIEEDEKLREARARAQGGRWMDSSNLPHNLPKQTDQEEVKEAAAKARTPEFQEEQKLAADARHLATGGRWA